jgi:sugar/nucleoside kinase (ribokinase family)
MQAVRFVAVGELLVDVLATGSGHEASIGVVPGGSAFNAAIAAAALGAETTVIGTVGGDPGGRMILAELAGHGVDAEISVSAGSTGTFLLAGGEIRVDRGASREIALADEIDADAVLVSGYLAPETISSALARARAPWVALDAALLSELPPGGNVLIANEETARRLTGVEPEQAVVVLGERYRLACVTRGPSGAIAVLDGVKAVARPPSRVDTASPGAGDAFAAALLVTLARGLPLEGALAEGCQRGQLAVARTAGSAAGRAGR